MVRRSFFISKTLFTGIFCLGFFLGGSFRPGFAQFDANDPVGLKVTGPYMQSSFSLNKKTNPVICISGYIPGNFSQYFRTARQEVELDSMDSYVVLKSTVSEEIVGMPIILTFDEYVHMIHKDRSTTSWRDYFTRNLSSDQVGRRSAGGINLDIPVKIKSKTFQKIFGSGTLGLNVTGNISIKSSLRREDRSEVRSVLSRGANTNFKMEQTQRFSVTGKIGDKVTVNVDQDSERAFDFENNIRIHYQGHEDEIIRKIEAGNISLSLPGTRYVTFSGKSSGLFGIKSELVLGNMNITTIASQEKGISKKLTLAGGATQGAKRIRDYQYLRNSYFFLDFSYREEYRNFFVDGNHIASQRPLVDIEVYKSAARYEERFPDESVRAWATLNAVAADTIGDVRAGFAQVGHFIRLEKDEYFVETNLGFIRLNNSISKEEILAVTYTLGDGTVVGGRAPDDTVNSTIIFKLIKPRNPRPTDDTWDFEFKHVYSLGARNIEQEGFDVKIFFEPPSGVVEEVDQQGRKWLEVFGLDTKDQDGTPNSPDGLIDLGSAVVDLFNGELIFPDLKPFDPVGIRVNGNEQPSELPQVKRTPAIYDTTVQSVISAQSKFYIEVKTQNRSSDFNLGFNVIEGSEVVTLDGEILQNGRDYTLDYFTGSLTILDERATNPASQLDVTYERNQLFQLEKKTILGVRAEYNLGRNSFFGGTLLYLSESTLDRKVRVGRGPRKNIVLDLNTRLNSNPNFIGRILDFMPLIRSKGETTLNFEGEIAQVLPTPNTLNSKRTGDNRGVAYIDDFEGAKKSISLGVLRKNWTRASAPNTLEHSYVNMVNYIWFNPLAQVFIQDIFPEREVNPNVPNRVDVLTLQTFPDQNNPDPNTWGGVMRNLSPGVFDQSQTKFIEVMVRGNQGRFHIDLGAISEDVIPNGRLDTEDKVGGFKNGILDDGEDLGIDGVAKPDPPELNHSRTDFAGMPSEEVPYDFWDVNNNDIKDEDEPWSYDDWFYIERTTDYIQEDGKGSINGTENNANDAGGRRPDTEDINGNGIVDRANSYFTYSFSLTKDHPDTSLIVGGNPNKGWFLYRIPFETGNDSLRVGSPTATQIEYVRLWVDEVTDFNNPLTLSVAEINLVGSEWKELGSTDNEYRLSAFGDTTVSVTQINTHEDARYAMTLSEIGVEGQEDRITGIRAREQSLVLLANDLDGANGFNAGVARKSLFQPENYIHYERIRMFVYGLERVDNDVHIPNDTSAVSNLEYFFRMGADPNNFYEYRSTVYEGWNERNHMDVRLQEFTNFDLSQAVEDTLNGVFIKYLTPDSSKSIRVKGNPSLTNIRVLTLGLKNLHPTEPFNGQIWVNELRLSNVEQAKGVAMRARATMKIGNLASINGEIEKKSADFHNVAQRFGTGDNSLSTSLNATVNLENLLPQSWGLAIPVNINMRRSNSTPKYFPGKDRLVTGGLPDSTLDLVRSIRSQSGFNIAFRRQAKSKNFFVKNSLDKLSFSLGRSKNSAENPSLRFSNNSSWTGNIDYRLDFGKNNFISPLSWLPSLPLLKKVKGTKIYYTPQNVSFRVNGSKTDQSSQNRIQNSDQDAPIRETRTFNLTRTMRTNMKVFENLSVDFSRTDKADMRGRGISDFFKGNFEDINEAQTFSARYNPNIFGWLNNTFNYSSNYTFTNNIQQQNTGRSARLNTTRSGDFTLRWQQLARSIFGVGKQKSSTRGRTRPGSRTRPGEKKSEEDEKKDEKKQGASLNPLKLFGGFVSKFKDISVNYSERKNISQFGLADGTPSLGFQFGLSDTTGVGTVENLTTNNTTFGENRSIRVGSGIAFGRAFDVGLTFQKSEQSNKTTIISGSKSQSWLQYGGFDMAFPEWSVRISELQKLPLFSRFFKRVSFSHSFSGQRDIRWSGPEQTETQIDFTTNFRPLGKLDLDFKNGFTGSIQMNRSTTLNRSLAVGSGARRTNRSDVSVTTSFSKRSGFRLPIWPFNKKELKNSINFTFSFTASSVVTEQSRGQVDGEDQFEEQDRTDRWSFSPKLTYSFSNQVRGGAFVEVGRTNSKRSGKTSIQEFGIDINIAIAGN